MIQAPKLGGRIMRYELADCEWDAIKPMLPNKPRGIPRVNDRRVLNGIFWVLRSGAPRRDAGLRAYGVLLHVYRNCPVDCGSKRPSMKPAFPTQSAFLISKSFIV